jgi:hypothetical protein
LFKIDAFILQSIDVSVLRRNVYVAVCHDYLVLFYKISLYYMIYLTAIGLPAGGSSTVHIYTQTIHGTTQSTQTIHKTTQFTNLEECGPCPVIGSVYTGICLTTEEKARKNLSQGSRRMPAGTVKTEYTEQSIQTIRIHSLQNLTKVYITVGSA